MGADPGIRVVLEQRLPLLDEPMVKGPPSPRNEDEPSDAYPEDAWGTLTVTVYIKDGNRLIKDGHISPAQVLALFGILIMGKLMNSSVLILVHYGHNTPQWLLLISELMIVLLIAVMIPLYQDPTKHVIDYCFEYFGPIVGFLFSLILFVALLLDLSTSLTLDYEQVHTLFLPTTPTVVIVLTMIISMVIPSYFGIEILGRASLVLSIAALTVILTLTFMSGSLGSIQNLPPILGPGIPTLLQQGMLHMGFFGEFLTYLMIRPYLRSYSSYQRSLYLLAVGTLILGMIQLTLLQLIFPYPTDDYLFFPSMESIKLIYVGRFIQHIEAVYAIAWLMTACLRLSLMLYLLSLMAASMTRSHNYRRFIPSVAALVYYISLLPSSLSDAIDFKDVVLEQRLPFLYGSILVVMTIVGYAKLWRKKRADAKRRPLPST